MEFERNEVEHTFSTGRTFVIRQSIPMTVLLFKAIEDGDPELAEGLSEWVEGGGEIQVKDETAEARMSSMRMAGKITRAIIEAMFLSPRVVWESEGPLAGDTILVEDLRDEEMNEVIEIAMKSVQEAARFREDDAGLNGGAGGEDVEQKPKRAARPKSGKR